jgi:rhodanese-related sulfurtransferase
MIFRKRQAIEKTCWKRLSRTCALRAVLVLTVFMPLLSARAGQPSSQGKVLHLDARGLDLLLHSDPNLLLIDVRTPRELTGPLGKIPESSNVPVKEIENNPERFPRDKTLVLICRTGHRSLKAANLLAEHGYIVYSVDGGMRAWRKLHPKAKPTPEELRQKKPDAHGQAPDATKPSPGGKKDHLPSPDKFFDSNMGC